MSEGDRFTNDAQRYLDGLPHGDLEERERREADRLAAAAAELGESLASIDATLDERVMDAVRMRTGPARRLAAWRWLFEPRQMRPVWIPAIAAAAALVVMVAAPRGGQDEAVTGAVATQARVPDTVFVRFELVAPAARTAAVAGSFNDWQADALPMVQGSEGRWTVTVALPVGEHQYQFVLDGSVWRTDPTAHAQVSDGFGGTNSVIVVGPKGLVRT